MKSTICLWDMAERQKAAKKVGPPAPTLHFKTEEEEMALLVANMLARTEMRSVEQLVLNIQQSEEEIYGVCKNIQSLNSELEQLDLTVKVLDASAVQQSTELESIERVNDRVRQDLENEITHIHKSIALYEEKYNANMSILSVLSLSLFNVLKNVASDEDAMDQQLLSSGVTDRNIEEYLGAIEGRIDELVQMSKTMSHGSIMEISQLLQSPNKKGHLQVQPIVLPSLLDAMDDQQLELEDGNDANRIQPVNIAHLKAFMQKKIQVKE